MAVSLLLSLLATPWISLSWWKIFRRCVSIAAAVCLWFFVKKLERRSFRSYGLIASAAGKRQFQCGLLLGLGTLALLLGLGLASGACRIAVSPERVKLWGTVIGFLPAALLVGVLEELVFRGFILHHLAACSKIVAVMTSSGLYAIVHVKTLAFDPGTWRELAGLFLLGGVLALTVLRTQQLSLAIGLHASLAYGARINKLLIEFPDPSMAWLVGTNRLINGVASWVALLGVAGMVMWWTRGSHWGGGAQHEQAR